MNRDEVVLRIPAAAVSVAIVDAMIAAAREGNPER